MASTWLRRLWRGYLLAGTVLPPVGRFSDLSGRERTYPVGSLVIGLGLEAWTGLGR